MPTRKVVISEILKSNAGVSKADLEKSRKMLVALRKNGMRRSRYRLNYAPAEGRTSDREEAEDPRTILLRGT